MHFISGRVWRFRRFTIHAWSVCLVRHLVRVVCFFFFSFFNLTTSVRQLYCSSADLNGRVFEWPTKSSCILRVKRYHWTRVFRGISCILIHAVYNITVKKCAVLMCNGSRKVPKGVVVHCNCVSFSRRFGWRRKISTRTAGMTWPRWPRR